MSKPGSATARAGRFARWRQCFLTGAAFAACGPLTAQAESLARGEALYMSECSKCHGLMGDDARRRPGNPRAAAVRVGLMIPENHSDRSGAVSPGQLAFALPYGPPLAGVYGRAAGALAGFEYSRAFLSALEGVEWREQTLDTYLTDSQSRAPGARMFYKQPDDDVRAAIIAFLRSRS